jgi:predicted N-acetyltransferase YhbS
MPSGIFLRPLKEQDGPALAGLSYSAADGGLIHYAANYQIDAYKAIQALHGDVEGVAACAHDSSRLVGVGLVRLGKCQFEGAIYPFAMLGNLIVHPDYRGQGLAAQLVQWQVEKAHERCGEEMVIVTNFQVGNRISHKIYNRWLEHFAHPMLYLPLRTAPSVPPNLRGVSTGPLSENEYEAFAECHNMFYADTNFFQPLTGDDLIQLCLRTPLKSPIRHAYAAVNSSGQLLAGLVVMEEYRLKQMEIRGLPKSLEVINNVLGVIPKDGMVRELYLDHIWYMPGQIQAARQLIDTVRWIWSNRATTTAVMFDPTGPLRKVFSTYPWTVKAKTHMLFHAPAEMSPGKSVCPIF